MQRAVLVMAVSTIKFDPFRTHSILPVLTQCNENNFIMETFETCGSSVCHVLPPSRAAV
ncbi:hypothetical protein GJAV_G00030060 [Gymnothorax javanicus]|nr:hypothetical protein GJAV_G00030060 [Gymnothorax javanicus]